MKKHMFFLTLFSVISISSYSQIVFEKGYLIDQTNQKVECLIKNIDWRTNPTEFDYKLSQNGAVQKATIKNVKEFGIYGSSKYIRARVEMDRSSDNTGNLSSERRPNFQEEELFLKVLVEGEASLFSYTDDDLFRFFYTLNDSAIEQLVYKRYLIEKHSVHYIQINNLYRQQLFLELKCQEITMNDIKRISYKERDLKRFFIEYNMCANSNYTDYEPSEKQDLFNLSIRPGINFSSLSAQNSEFDEWNSDFGNKMNFRIGLEAELIFPFNKNKWSVIIEPTYQYYNAEKSKEISTPNGPIISKVNYQSIEIPIGIRHYFFLNNESKIFLNAFYVLDFSSESNIELSYENGYILESLDIMKAKGNFGFGLGYKFKDKYGIEARYQPAREILGNYALWSSEYSTLSLIIGYSLF